MIRFLDGWPHGEPPKLARHNRLFARRGATTVVRLCGGGLGVGLTNNGTLIRCMTKGVALALADALVDAVEAAERAELAGAEDAPVMENETATLEDTE